ncbi:MAG: acylphosphatase [Alphaproteobacteria bacterium]|nr:acylphosphatase [Alphaproteobacteria bacterium]
MQLMAVRVRIHGRVQGVGYRAWTVVTANRLELSGWVRNRADGTVEAIFKGEEPTIRQMLDACREGPPAARVERVEEEPARGIVEAGFAAKPTV